MGRAIPELGDAAIRERFVHRYRIIYRLDAGRVLIVAVIHWRQDFSPVQGRMAVD
jgi:toxin ParE1/3/4